MRPTSLRGGNTEGESDPVRSISVRLGWRDWTLILCALGVFIVLAATNLQYPGLNLDEATDGMISLYVGWPASSSATEALTDKLTLFEKTIPIMAGDYLGAVGGYLLFPAIAFMGSNVYALRITSIGICLVWLFLIYRVCLGWFGRRAAAITLFLSATGLLFVQYGRLAFHREEIYLAAIFWLALYFFQRYEQTRLARFAYLTAFVMGVGLSAKITFLWYVVGCAVVLALFERGIVRGLGYARGIVGCLAFLAGAGLIVFHNFHQRGATFKILVNSLLFPEHALPSLVRDNMQYFSNLFFRAGHFRLLLQQVIDPKICQAWGVSQATAIDCLAPGVAVIMGVGLIYGLVAGIRTPAWKKKVLSLYTVYGVIFLLCPFTVSGLDLGHLVALLPFPQVMLGLSLDSLYDKFRANWVGRYCVWGCLAFVFVFQVGSNTHFSYDMKRNGGSGRWSTAIYELVPHLELNGINAPVVFGCGLAESIIFMSDMAVQPIRCYSDSMPGRSVRDVYGMACARGGWILWSGTPEESEERFEALRALAEGKRATVDLQKTFHNKIGEPVYWIYRIVRHTSSAAATRGARRSREISRESAFRSGA